MNPGKRRSRRRRSPRAWPAPGGVRAPRPRRLHHRPRRRPSRGICSQECRAPELCQRLHRLGRHGGRAGRSRPRSSSTAATPSRCKDQVDPALYVYRHLITEPADAYIAAEVKRKGRRSASTPNYFTPDQAQRFRAAAARVGAGLVAVDSNPVDEIWAGRPADPISAGRCPTTSASPARARPKSAGRWPNG